MPCKANYLNVPIVHINNKYLITCKEPSYYNVLRFIDDIEYMNWYKENKSIINVCVDNEYKRALILDSFDEIDKAVQFFRKLSNANNDRRSYE